MTASLLPFVALLAGAATSALAAPCSAVAPAAPLAAAPPAALLAQQADDDAPAPDADADAEADAEAAIRARGRELTAWFHHGELDALWDAFGPGMRAAMGDQRATLDAFKHQLDTQLGAETEVLREVALAGLGERVYKRVSRFEKLEQPMEHVLQFDAEGVVTGFLIRAQREAHPSEHLDYRTKTELQLPFEGAWTVFWGGRDIERNYHVFTRDQRFAYDLLVMVDGATHTGSGERLEDYHAWGRRVLAPGAGTVLATANDVPDNPPRVMNPAQALGNHVILDHGNGEYSFLAHFQQGTVTVEPGDEVTADTVLGLCGNSGNTTEPHLHYHLQDTPDFGDGDGLPAAFVRYRADGEPVARGEPERPQVVQRDAP